MNETLFRRVAAVTAIISAPLALGASFVLLAAIDFDAEIMADPVGLLALGDSVAATFRWVEFVGLFGYYLLLVPATLYLWIWLRPYNPDMVTLATILGLASIFIGSIGSIQLFSAMPPILSAYSQAAEAQRELLRLLFQAAMDEAVTGFLAFAGILFGLWALGIGPSLRRERRALGLATLAMGVIFVLYGVGAGLRLEFLSSLENLTFLGPIWALWLGLAIWRRGG